MRFHVTHVTRYTYSGPISETHMEVRLRPADEFGQRVEDFQLSVEPDSAVREYVDGFGNHVHYFDHMPAHELVQVTSRSLVETGLAAERRPSDDEETPEDFLLFRPPVVDAPAVHRMARRHQPEELGRAAMVEAALDELTVAISRDFEYRPETTTVTTAVDEVLRLRSGVCQDFAHLFLASARALSIPARYVSGYVYSSPGGVMVGASHAWAEAWVPGRGWLGYDATHPVRAGEQHVRVAVGRDYRDAAPTRGVYVGAARGQLQVRVEIAPV